MCPNLKKIDEETKKFKGGVCCVLKWLWMIQWSVTELHARFWKKNIHCFSEKNRAQNTERKPLNLMQIFVLIAHLFMLHNLMLLSTFQTEKTILKHYLTIHAPWISHQLCYCAEYCFMVSNRSYAGISAGSGARRSYISQREVEVYAFSMVLEIRSFLVLSILK